jgi:hypothetical protein
VTALVFRFIPLLLALPLLSIAQQKPSYDMHRTSEPIMIDGRLDEAAWKAAKPVGDFHFNWWTSGEKEQAVAKILWDDANLYIGYYCRDKNISANVTRRHGPVSLDDCVEAFISPNPEKVRNYYGFEMNVLGTMLNFTRTDWWRGGRFSEPVGVRLWTTHYHQSLKTDTLGEDHWILEVAIPFENFEKDAAHTPPHDGDRWRLNLNRSGGTTNSQYSTWSPVTTERPSFHVPEDFGWVRFVKRLVGTD